MKNLGFSAGTGLSCFLWSQNSLAVETVTAEKNCNLRIDGEEFKIGERVLVFKEQDGKRKRLAIVEIAKVLNQQRALGRVVKGPAVCTGLKGALVDSSDEKGGRLDGGSKPSGNRFEGHIDAMLSFVDQPSLGYPGKQIDSAMPRLRGVGFLAQANVYPMAFVGNNFINNLFGVGFEFSYASVFPESEITAADGTVAGKLQQRLPICA